MPQRYEKEIEEILRKAEESGWGKVAGQQTKPAPPSQPLPGRPQSPTRRRVRWSPGSILALAVILNGVLFIFNFFARDLVSVLTPIAVIFLIGAIFYYFSQSSSSSPTVEKRWRGQRIDLDESESPFQRIANDLRRLFRRR